MFLKKLHVYIDDELWVFNVSDNEFQALTNCFVFLCAVRVMGKRERANDCVQRRKLISERSVIFFFI